MFQASYHLNKHTHISLFPGLGKMPAKIRAYQESDSPLEIQPSRQNQAQQQSDVFPNKASNKPRDIAKTSPLSLLFPDSYPIQPQPLSFSPTHQDYSPQQEPLSENYPPSCTANSYLSGLNALGQLYMNQLFPQPGQEMEVVPNRPPRPKREMSGESNSQLSQELDIKPGLTFSSYTLTQAVAKVIYVAKAIYVHLLFF